MNVKKRIENLLHFIEVYQCIGADTISKKDLQERHKKTMTKSTSHGNKIIHQRVVHFMEKFRERQPCRFFNILQIELFFCNHELKAKKKAVVHLIVPNHRY